MRRPAQLRSSALAAVRSATQCEAKALALTARANGTTDPIRKRELEELARSWEGMASVARWQDNHDLRSNAIEAVGELLRSKFAVVDQNAKLEALLDDLDEMLGDGGVLHTEQPKALH